MDIIDCNNHVKSAIEFFGPSCAINSLIDRYNPIGDNSYKLCQLCIGKVPGGKCTNADPYAGFQGAFRCLLEVGDIAFLKHTTVEEMTSSDEFTGVSKEGFELLCRDGTRQPVHEFRSCNWGTVPTHAVVTTSAAHFDKRKKLQKFLEKAVELYSHDQNNLRYNSTTDRNFPWNRPDENRDRDRDRDFNRDQNRFNRFKRQYRDEAFNPNEDRYRPRQETQDYTPNPNRNTQFETRFRQQDSFNRYNPDDTRDNFFSNTGTSDDRNRFDDRDRPNVPDDNVTFYEKFDIFESVPRYGIHHNLIFQVRTVRSFRRKITLLFCRTPLAV